MYFRNWMRVACGVVIGLMFAVSAEAQQCVTSEQCPLGICQGQGVGPYGTVIPGQCNNLNEGNCPVGVGDIVCERIRPSKKPIVVKPPVVLTPTKHPQPRPFFPRTPKSGGSAQIIPGGPSGGSLLKKKSVTIELEGKLGNVR